jgi:aryl-alcohol dehydrogenase-like predicted oxidoreductase
MRRSDPTPPPAPTVDATLLRATASGTADFGQRHKDRFTADYFRATTFGATVSSVGIGTYLGDTTIEVDVAYEAAIRRSVECGINLIDTAINYRNQRSEHAIGTALQQIFSTGRASRQELVVCSKAGYIPLDRTPPASRAEYQAYVQHEFIDTEILRTEEIVSGGHSLAPRFLRYCLAKSRQNLGLRTIDVYYLHNPEHQQSVLGSEEFLRRIRPAFALLEESASRGEVGVYGVSTWDGLRVRPGERTYISLEELVRIAREVGGDAHHLRAVQLPLNLAMLEAATEQTQSVRGKPMTVLQAAVELGLTVIGSATLMQGTLATGLPSSLRDDFPSCSTDAQCAIEFARWAPGVSSSLVGMKRREHVDENLGPMLLRATTSE